MVSWGCWKAFFLGWLAIIVGSVVLELLLARILGLMRLGPVAGLVVGYVAAYNLAPGAKHANAIASVAGFLATGLLLIIGTLIAGSRGRF